MHDALVRYMQGNSDKVSVVGKSQNVSVFLERKYFNEVEGLDLLLKFVKN